jgi:hypothetical protein
MGITENSVGTIIVARHDHYLGQQIHGI